MQSIQVQIFAHKAAKETLSEDIIDRPLHLYRPVGRHTLLDSGVLYGTNPYTESKLTSLICI